MKRAVTFGIFIAFFVGCGGGIGGSSARLVIRASGKDMSLAVKSSGTDRSVKTFTDIGGKVSTATSFYAIMANYDMDITNVGTMKKPLASADQIRLMLQLIGEEGTDQRSELKPGVYRADPNGKFMKIDSLTVTAFSDGKETKIDFDTMFSGSKITGQVDVKSVTADSISGTIDVTDGDKSIKGDFSAKIAAKK